MDRADGGRGQTQETGLIKRTAKPVEARTERLARGGAAPGEEKGAPAGRNQDNRTGKTLKAENGTKCGRTKECTIK